MQCREDEAAATDHLRTRKEVTPIQSAQVAIAPDNLDQFIDPHHRHIMQSLRNMRRQMQSKQWLRKRLCHWRYRPIIKTGMRKKPIETNLLTGRQRPIERAQNVQTPWIVLMNMHQGTGLAPLPRRIPITH